MAQVAGKHTQLGIRMMSIDVGDTRIELCARIETQQSLAGRHNVHVSDLNKLHDPFSGCVRGSSCALTLAHGDIT